MASELVDPIKNSPAGTHTNSIPSNSRYAPARGSVGTVPHVRIAAAMQATIKVRAIVGPPGRRSRPLTPLGQYRAAESRPGLVNERPASVLDKTTSGPVRDTM